MKKMNVMRSSEFHMDEGDVLHMLFLDEFDTPITFTLNSIDPITGDSNDEEVPGVPVALPASDITSNSFTANWNFMENTLGFLLYVATDSAFTFPVAGYNGLDVGLVNEYPVVGLDDAIPYYYRVKGYNDYGGKTGTLYSNTITLTTACELITDFDGNVYTYVTIGTQQWMVENLRTTSFRDGSPITNVIGNAAWAALITEGYCAYNNDPLNIPIYGLFYNWYAVDHHNVVAGAYLAPTGWRVPSDVDFTTLRTFLGGESIAGGKLKETGIAHWDIPNTGATDEHGFKALGGGRRSSALNLFIGLKIYGYWWSSVLWNPINGLNFEMYNNSEIFFMNGYTQSFGLSVRCMRDV